MNIKNKTLLWTLFASIMANSVGALAAASVIEGRGGVAYLRSLLTHRQEVKDPAAQARVGILASLPIPAERPIVMLGDSLTAMCEWHELLSDPRVLNRGVGGETSGEVLDRLPEIIRLRPEKVFLMIGTNDLQGLKLSPEQEVAAQRAIISQLLLHTGATVYVEELLPTRTPKFNSWSGEVNQRMRQQFPSSSPRCLYVELRKRFEDADGLLKREYTFDGIHLTAAGYVTWREAIEPLLTAASPSPARMP